MEQQVFVFDKYGLSIYMGYQCTVDVSLFWYGRTAVVGL